MNHGGRGADTGLRDGMDGVPEKAVIALKSARRLHAGYLTTSVPCRRVRHREVRGRGASGPRRGPLRMAHPRLKAGQEDAAADRVNEKAVPDALGRGMGASGDAGIGNDRRDLGKQRHPGLRPDPFIGGKAGSGAADTMHLVEKINDGVGDGDRSRNLGVLKDNRPAGAVDVPGRESERLREIAAGVMQDAAKSPDGILRAVRRRDKGAALLLVEKEPLSLLVE